MLVFGDTDRYHSLISIGLTDFSCDKAIHDSFFVHSSGNGCCLGCTGWSHVGSIGPVAYITCGSTSLASLTGRVDVVVAGLGNKVRVVGTTKSGDLWSARLTGVDLGDRPFTPQKMVMPSSERLSVRLEPIESDLQLIVKGRLGERVPTPTIASEGDLLVVSFADLSGPEPLPRGRLDLRRPGRVAQEVMAPPMRPRAVAPPLGDMAIGTMVLQNRSYVNVSGPPVNTR